MEITPRRLNWLAGVAGFEGESGRAKVGLLQGALEVRFLVPNPSATDEEKRISSQVGRHPQQIRANKRRRTCGGHIVLEHNSLGARGIRTASPVRSGVQQQLRPK